MDSRVFCAFLNLNKKDDAVKKKIKTIGGKTIILITKEKQLLRIVGLNLILWNFWELIS